MFSEYNLLLILKIDQVFSFHQIIIQRSEIGFNAQISHSQTPIPNCQGKHPSGSFIKPAFDFHSYCLNVTHFWFNPHDSFPCSQLDSHIFFIVDYRFKLFSLIWLLISYLFSSQYFSYTYSSFHFYTYSLHDWNYLFLEQAFAMVILTLIPQYLFHIII